jgi:hypothetical protein
MALYSTAVAVSQDLLLDSDRPYDAGGFAIEPTAHRDVKPD